MTESRCLGNTRTDRKGKIQVYIDEDMYDAVTELQANKDATKMLKYIENLTKQEETGKVISLGNNKFTNIALGRLCPQCRKGRIKRGSGQPIEWYCDNISCGWWVM